MEESKTGVLFLVGTPIGNLGDITLRALDILKEVDLVAAEDTRQTRKLLNHYGIKKPLTSYYEHNKMAKGPVLIDKILAGEKIALVSDAGMPGISDPGADLVKESILKGIQVIPVPGPSAVITGLVASGLNTAGFVFGGFFPRGKKEQNKILEELNSQTRTVVFYESPRRLAKSLEVIKEHWGDRNCCVARELTKVHEEFLRGPLSEVLSCLQKRELKGEIVLFIEGNKQEGARGASLHEGEEHFRSLLGQGLEKKEALKETARILGLSKRELYNRVMR